MLIEGLSQLKRLVVQDCESMGEIILTKEFPGGGREIEEEEVKILFPKLESLTFVDLPNLTGFCTGCSIEFNSLTELFFAKCPALMSFVHKDASPQVTQVSSASEINQNTEIQSLFNEKVAFSNLERLHLQSMDSLISIWHNQFADDSFSKLKCLTIERCSKLSTVFPLHPLGRFKTLETLNLQFCSSVQEIYQLQDLHGDGTQGFELKDLFIDELSSLKLIWRADSKGNISFPNLRSIEISCCKNLKNIFPASMAKNLRRLEKLNVEENSGLEEIIAKAEDAGEEEIQFEFPKLSSIKLKDLRGIKSFYPGRHVLECPELKCVDVHACYKVTKFTSKIHGRQAHGEGQPNIPPHQSLFLVEKVPNLEELTLEKHDQVMMETGIFPFERFSKLKVLRLLGNQGSAFLKRNFHLDKLVVKWGSVEELFSFEGLDDKGQPARVKHLELSGFDKLKDIWKEHSLLGSHLQNLQTLKVEWCSSLTNIAPRSSPFQNLLSLQVSYCHGLLNLVNASTAKTMVQLTEMRITYCKKMTEIVTNDGDDCLDADEISFRNLKVLELDQLPSLTRFCSGDHSLNFPSLEQAFVKRCSKMMILSGGAITPKLLRGELDDFREQQLEEGGKGNVSKTSLVK